MSLNTAGLFQVCPYRYTVLSARTEGVPPPVHHATRSTLAGLTLPFWSRTISSVYGSTMASSPMTGAITRRGTTLGAGGVPEARAAAVAVVRVGAVAALLL